MKPKFDERLTGLALAVCVGALTSCAPSLRTMKPAPEAVSAEERLQQEASKLKMATQQERINRVSSRLAATGGQLCGSKATGEPCRINVALVPSNEVNAFADGSKITITSGMMNFIASDEELALVLGHEVSHNSLGHIRKKRGNSFLGSMVDATVGAKTGINTFNIGRKVGGMVFSKAFEAEADYQGLYLAARAGYDIDKAADFWRRFSVVHPAIKKSTFLSSHPSNPERFVALEMTIREIRKKQAAKRDLVPESKSHN